MTETFKTDMQVEIERLEESDERGNYRVVSGNPLTGKAENEWFVTTLSINGYGMATSGMELSQYQKEIVIEVSESKANIVLEDN